MPVVPAIAVDIGFGSTWKTADASISWTEVTNFVMDRRQLVEVFRGATAAHGLAGAGTLSLILKNDDRRFDPLHASGPHFGDLVPGVPIRIQGLPSSGFLLDHNGDPVLDPDGFPIFAGVPIDLYRGFVTQWPQRSERGNTMSVAEVSAVDGFQNLSRAPVPASPLAKTLIDLGPQNYYPLAERSGPRVADAVGDGHGVAFDEPNFGQDALAESLQGSVRFDGINDRIDLGRAPLVADEFHMTLVAVIKTGTAGDVDTIRPVFAQSDGDGPGKNDALTLYVDADGKARLDYYENGGGFSIVGSAVTDNLPHLLIGQSNVGSGSDYGIAVDSATLSTTLGTAFYNGGVGAAIGGQPNAARDYSDNHFDGRISDVAIFTTPLTAANRAAIVDAYNGWGGDRSDARVARILDHIGWPADLRSLDTGKSTFGPATFYDGDNALGYLRLCEASEGGRMFIDPTGKLVFRQRHWAFTQTKGTASQFTFSDNGTDPGYAEFMWDLDDELVINAPRYSRRGGGEIRLDDSTSQDLYGLREDVQSDLLLQTDAEVRGRAYWSLTTRKDAKPRVRSIVVPLHAYDGADQETLLALDLGHRVTVQRTPQGVGSAISRDFHVDGIRHRIGVSEWWVEFYVSPAANQDLTLFTMGTSTLGGTHVLAF